MALPDNSLLFPVPANAIHQQHPTRKPRGTGVCEESSRSCRIENGGFTLYFSLLPGICWRDDCAGDWPHHQAGEFERRDLSSRSVLSEHARRMAIAGNGWYAIRRCIPRSSDPQSSRRSQRHVLPSRDDSGPNRVERLPGRTVTFSW